MTRRFACLALLCLISGAVQGQGHASRAREQRAEVVHSYPHDPSAFTQGLEYRGGFLYEGTGLEGRSSLRKVDLQSGRVLQETRLPSGYFGEGITVLNGRIAQLTWQSHTGFVYEQGTLRQTRSFQYPGEGWGLANDGKQIYMSDGTAEIRRWDGITMTEKSRLTVRDGGSPVMYLNELEWVHGELWANVWQTDRIARISPVDGHVLGWINLTGLLSDEDRSHGVDVLNGIAYDALGNRVFVTGKLWPKIFEIRLKP